MLKVASKFALLAQDAPGQLVGTSRHRGGTHPLVVGQDGGRGSAEPQVLHGNDRGMPSVRRWGDRGEVLREIKSKITRVPERTEREAHVLPSPERRVPVLQERRFRAGILREEPRDRKL